MKLTFYQNKFVLQIHSNLEWLRLPLNVKATWERDNAAGNIFTKNIKEATRFRKYADNIAEKVFKYHMLKSYPLPARGLISPPGLEYMPFQRDKGIPFLLSGNRKYLAHQPGLGKSAQFIALVSTKPGKALIICPSFLKINWAREITKWFVDDFPSIDIVPESGKQHEMNWGADFIICSDSMLLKEWVRDGLLKVPFRHIAIDEGHRFKSVDAARTIALYGGTLESASGKKATLKSPGLIYKAEHVCILSGTPLLSRSIELWPTIFAMAPEIIDFMSYSDFGFRYGAPRQDEFGRWQFLGTSNETELKERLQSGFMQVMKKEDVLTELPPKIRDVIFVDKDRRKKDVKTLDAKLRKELNLKGYDKAPDLGEYAKLKHENGLAKVNFVSDLVASYLSTDPEEQILLFAYHRDVVQILSRMLFLFKPVVIQGGVSADARLKIEDDFQAGKSRLIIGNIDAMNLGLTLTKATRVVFCEYSETPAMNDQAEDRAHRKGQLSSVYCQYVAIADSIDERRLEMILRKENAVRKVIG